MRPRRARKPREPKVINDDLPLPSPAPSPDGLERGRAQWNLVRKSLMTDATPSSVRASLSRVWDAGNKHSVSMRLSRMSACDNLALHYIDQVKDHPSFGAHHEIANHDLRAGFGIALV